MKAFFVAPIMTLAVGSVAMQVRNKEELQSAKSRPNFVWILADDLHYEPGILEMMPNLKKLTKEGLEFPNHISQSPLCGPSRASLLTGRLTHNSGYKSNTGREFKNAFLKGQDESIGKWLIDVGYYTAFLGKYVNGIVNTHEEIPKGWRYFGGFSESYNHYTHEVLAGAYAYYNSSQWDLLYDQNYNLLEKENRTEWIKIRTGIHQADFLATQTLEQAKAGVDEGKPFFVLVNPLMVHHGTCEHPLLDGKSHKDDDPWWEEEDLEHMGAISPCVSKERRRLAFAYLKQKLLHGQRTSAWNQTALGQQWGHSGKCCNSEQIARMEVGARNRTGSFADLDDMIGVIIKGLSKLNVMDKTYVIFTSDNGFHLGEHQFWYGKELPYGTDVRVPMVIRTPGGATRGVRYLPTNHVDITRTIVELTGAEEKVAKTMLDGLSFAAALTKDVSVKNWRSWSFSEMFEPHGKTWRNIRHISDAGEQEWSMNLWCTGEVEIFHVSENDPDEMVNVLAPEAGTDANEWGQLILDSWLPVINGMGTCKGDVCNQEDKVRKKTKGTDFKARADLIECRK